MDFLRRFLRKYFLVYALVIGLFIGSATLMDRTVTALAEAMPVPRSVTVVIDPGHGGEGRRRSILYRGVGKPDQPGDFSAAERFATIFGV